MKNKVNILDYNAKPDMDCMPLFQQAEDDMSALGGGVIHGPKLIYDVSGPFYHRSFNTLKLNGGTIRNSQKSKGTGSDQFCILIGNFSQSDYSACVHLPANDIKAGTNKVTLKDKANLYLILIGGTVLIDSNDGFIIDVVKFKPYQAFINRVIGIIGDEIVLEDPISTDITGANIAPTSLRTWQDDKSYICQRPVIRDVRFESLGDWTLRFGAYKMLMENVSIKSTDGIGGNGFSHCTFKNIRIEFCQKLFEWAMYSHDSTIDGVIAKWWPGEEDSSMSSMFKMGENMRDNVFNNIQVDSGAGKYYQMIARFEHAFGNKITNSKFNCPTVSKNAIEFTSSDPKSIVIDNEVSGCEFTLGTLDSFVKCDSPGIITGNKVFDNKILKGTFRKGQVINNADASNIIL